MIPAALIRPVLLLAVMLSGSASAAFGAAARNGTVDPTIHSQTSEHFVNGHYDKTGIYIPPHYQPVTKPRLHGYFFNKQEGGDQTQKPN